MLSVDQSAGVFFLASLYRREDSVEIISMPCGMGGSVCAYLFDDGVIFQADEFLRIASIGIQAYARRPRGSGIIRPSSIAVSIHS